MVFFYIHIFGIEKFHMWSKNNFWFCLYSHFWHWKFYISTEINFWFCFIITFLTLKCYTFMFGLYMCFETTCQMILMLCVDILLWRNIESDSLEFLFHQSFVGLYLWKDQEFKIVEEVWPPLKMKNKGGHTSSTILNSSFLANSNLPKTGKNVTFFCMLQIFFWVWQIVT